MTQDTILQDSQYVAHAMITTVGINRIISIHDIIQIIIKIYLKLILKSLGFKF